MVIDLDSGDAIHWVRFKGIVSEIYDVAMVTGARRPMAIGTRPDDIRRMILLALSEFDA